MSYKVYKNEIPADKKAIHTLKTTGETKLNSIKKFSKTHSKAATQNKIQKYLAWLAKLSKSSSEIFDNFNNFLVTRDEIEKPLEKFVNHPSTSKKACDDIGMSGSFDCAQKALKIMKKHPEWKYYIGGNGGTHHFIGYNDSDTDILEDDNPDDLTNFYINIGLFHFEDLDCIISGSSDYYDDDFLDDDATEYNWDKAHHCLMAYQNDDAKYGMLDSVPQTTVNKGCYLIYSGITDLTNNHHEWKNIKKILDGFTTIRKIKVGKSFDLNFNPKHNNRKQVCKNHSSKYWLKMFSYWPTKIEASRSDITNSAKQYIKGKKAMQKYNKLSNQWTSSKYKQYQNKHHDLIQKTIKDIMTSTKHAESKINKEEKITYFPNYAKKNIDVHLDKVRPYVVVLTFVGHQPYCIEQSDEVSDDFLNYTGKYNLRTKKITFTDNCSTQNTANDIFGMGIETTHANVRTYNAKDKVQLSKNFIKYYNDVLGCFEADGLDDNL